MRSGIARFFLLATLAVLLGSCGDPLAPDDPLWLASRGPTALAAPSALTTTSTSPSQISLAWRDNSTDETGFELFRSTTGLGGAFTPEFSLGANVSSYTNGGLEPVTQYCYQVRAVSVVKQKTRYSTFSNAVCATTKPIALSPASNLDAAPLAFGYGTRITWRDNSSNESGFRLERSTTSAGPWETVLTQWPNVTEAQNGVPAEQQFCYRVIAFNPQGDAAPSNTDCTTVPAGPTNLAVQSTGPQSIDLTWVDNSAVEDGYELQRRNDGGLWSVIANLQPNAASYHDVGVNTDVTYSYRVRAKKDGGFSFPSDEASAATATTPPNAPSGPQAAPFSSSGVAFSWLDQSPNEEGFRVERSVDNEASWQPAGATGPNMTSVGLEPDLLPESKVCYRVFAFNSQGESNSVTDCTTPPAGPSELMATAVDVQTVDLTWIDNSAVEDGYEVWAWYGGLEDPSELVAELPPNSMNYRDTRLYPYYAYWVVARKDGGYSDWSNAELPGTASVALGRNPPTHPGALRRER